MSLKDLRVFRGNMGVIPRLYPSETTAIEGAGVPVSGPRRVTVDHLTLDGLRSLVEARVRSPVGLPLSAAFAPVIAFFRSVHISWNLFHGAVSGGNPAWTVNVVLKAGMIFRQGGRRLNQKQAEVSDRREQSFINRRYHPPPEDRRRILLLLCNKAGIHDRNSLDHEPSPITTFPCCLPVPGIRRAARHDAVYEQGEFHEERKYPHCQHASPESNDGYSALPDA